MIKILNGFEGHTKEQLVKLVDIVDFLYKCLDTKNTEYDLDDIIEFVETSKYYLKEDYNGRIRKRIQI